MSLVEHARRELELIGEDPEMIDWYCKVIQAFADFGHSGGSASVTIPVLNALLQFKPLSPITDDPDEWMNVTEMTANKHGLWQNLRNSEAFSHNGGQSYYLLSEGGNDKNPSPLHVSASRRK